MEDIIKEIRKKLDDYLKNTQYKLNPDEKLVEELLNALAKRKEKTGQFYCPCRVISHNAAKDKDIICPCIYHEHDIAEKGVCFCGLIVKK